MTCKYTGVERTYAGDNFELLALAVLGLGDGLLQTRDGLVVEVLHSLASPQPHKLHVKDIPEHW